MKCCCALGFLEVAKRPLVTQQLFHKVLVSNVYTIWNLGIILQAMDNEVGCRLFSLPDQQT